MLNRWIEADRLLDVLDAEGIGCIAFSPLVQGMLTDKYLHGVPADSRAAAGKSLPPALICTDYLRHAQALAVIAARRGQSLAQMALAWVLRDLRLTSALIGASRETQIEAAVAALDNWRFREEEQAEIDQHAVDGGLKPWAASSRS